MLTNILIIGIVLLSIIATYLYITLYRSCNDTVSELEEENDQLIQVIGSMYERLYEDIKQLEQIDKGGSFRSDDEVGFAFLSIKNVFTDLLVFIEKNINNTDIQEDDSKEKKEKR